MLTMSRLSTGCSCEYRFLINFKDGTLFLLRIRSAHLGMVQESWVSLQWCLLRQRYFCAVYNYARKTFLSIGYWDPKRKLGVTLTTRFL